ncbi:zinc finger protein 664-like [Antennarius striatus]|uniref:zinc finger protein 664-like n=1 Tax=Antennarius striatus TaxID=241820 RepID=UPI0035B304CD
MDPQPKHIKEEDHEVWASQQNEEETQQVEEFDESCLPRSSVCWDNDDQDDIKPHLQPPAQNGESEKDFQSHQETKTLQFILPLTSASQILIQNGTESERSGSRPANQTQSEDNQSSFITSGESVELFRLSSRTEYRCHLCDKYFSSNQHLINHAFRMHSKDADILCAVCGKTLESKESLCVHLQSHKGSNCCHVCGKRYNSKTSLTEHMASHAGVKLHRCQVCGKECSRKGDLKIHMRIHTGEKPFSCSFCCKRFTHSGHLKKHMRSHTGERPHQCGVCGRGFLQSTHLKYHLGTHTQKY